MSGFVSRGFGGRRRVPDELAGRLPPGQYVEPRFPVLTAGPTERIEPADWRMRIDGMVAEPLELSWDELHTLPAEPVPCDIHCVTKWSKFDTSFTGVPVAALLDRVQPQGRFAMAHSYGGYTTNLALADLGAGKAWVVWGARGPAAARRARRPRPPSRATPLLLEEREVAGRAADHGPRRAGLLGDQRLPQPWRPLEGRAVLERLTTPVPRAPGAWQVADVVAIREETPHVKTFVLEPPMWMPHLPGQHYDVRLTAPDGYRAQRSYSIASSPLDEGRVELTVDRLADGEVSPYFHDVLEVGDQVEVRGPFASYFVWRGEAPALLIGGGSGVVPLMAMLRHRRRIDPETPMRLIYSVRHADDVIYADELDTDAELTFTQGAPDGWSGHTGRIDAALIGDPALGDAGVAFICGSNAFVEAASLLLLDLGVHASRIRTERFGPTS